MASTTPNFDRRRDQIRSRQLTMRDMLKNPKAFFTKYIRRKKSAYKKKAVKRVNRTKTTMDKVWFGQPQRGGKINSTKRVARNTVPLVFQYYQ